MCIRGVVMTEEKENYKSVSNQIYEEFLNRLEASNEIDIETIENIRNLTEAGNLGNKDKVYKLLKENREDSE